MVNQEIFTIPLTAWLKFSASLQLVFFSNTVWVVTQGHPKIELEESRNCRGNGSLLAPWDHSPKGQRDFQEMPPAAHIQQTQPARRQQQAARLKRKRQQGLPTAAHSSAPSLSRGIAKPISPTLSRSQSPPLPPSWVDDMGTRSQGIRCPLLGGTRWLLASQRATGSLCRCTGCLQSPGTSVCS